MRKAQQKTFDFKPWGGEREGAGRKPASPRSRATHSSRVRLPHYVPVLVTMRIRAGLPSLRTGRAHRALLEALTEGAERFGLRVIHYAAMHDHLHLVCEAENESALSRGMQGLGVRISKALNRCWERSGKVFADRFHCRHLTSPTQVRNTLAYVLNNAHHHELYLPDGLDPYSSARWFDGWSAAVPKAETTRNPLASPCTWLMTVGWTLLGRIELPMYGANDRSRNAAARAS
jgi:REP element-mobilizing transposase RayT